MPDYYMVKYKIECCYSVYYLIGCGEFAVFYTMKKILSR
jgi:hypothetical protein